MHELQKILSGFKMHDIVLLLIKFSPFSLQH